MDYLVDIYFGRVFVGTNGLTPCGCRVRRGVALSLLLAPVSMLLAVFQMHNSKNIKMNTKELKSDSPL